MAELAYDSFDIARFAVQVPGIEKPANVQGVGLCAANGAAGQHSRGDHNDVHIVLVTWLLELGAICILSVRDVSSAVHNGVACRYTYSGCRVHKQMTDTTC